jgi:hypothetical protein
LHNAPAPPPDPVLIQQPFASYLFLNQQLFQFGNLGFAAEKTKIIKESGLWFFARMSPVRTVPACQLGIKTNFLYPENGKQVTVMLIRCRGKHQAEFDAVNSPAIASVDKAASIQADVRTMLKKSSIVMFEETKQRERNKAIVYNLVVHDKLPLSRFNSAGFRRSFELVSEGRFKLVHRDQAWRITRTICNESQSAVIDAFAEQSKKRKITLALDCWSKKRTQTAPGTAPALLAAGAAAPELQKGSQ